MSPIKNFNLVYECLNEDGTFSEGDTISGAVTFTLTKQTKVKGLMVKAKGDANVHWTEGSGEDETSYSAHKRYFKLKEYLVPKNANGDTLNVVAKIHNSSSKKMRPKFSLQQRVVYRANTRAKHTVQNLWKKSGETVALDKEETVSCQVKIPADVIYTVHDCDIISVEHYFKVYLDISFAFDPEVAFPLVIVPPSSATFQPGRVEGPYPAGAAGAPSYSNFPSPAFPVGPYSAGAAGAPNYSNYPPPAFPVGPYPAPAGSGAYGNPALYPTLPANMTSGYNNPWPQQAAPYGFPTAASSTAQHQTPTAPPLFQQADAPPSYMSIFPPAQDTFSTTGSDKKS